MSLSLEKKLLEIGKKLQRHRFSKEYLLKTFQQAETCLAEVDQAPSDSILRSLTTTMHALVKPNILRHHDNDVRILVATCVSQVMRITAPEVLYTDDILMEIFELIVATFRGLDEIHSPSFGKRVIILENVARVRLCVLMLDLQCDDIILNLFYIFFKRARGDHSDNVLRAMQTILVEILNQNDFISEKLLSILLENLRRKKEDSPAAYRLAMNVMKCVAIKIEPNVSLFLMSIMSAESNFENDPHNYHEIILNIYQCAPQILRSIIPVLTQKLMSELSDVRLSSVKLLGRILALPGHGLAKEFQPLLSEFLKRFTDNSVEIRLTAVKYAKECILSNPSRPESSTISAALSDQLLDSDEAVQEQVIGAILDVGSLESDKPSEQHEEKSKRRSEVVLNEVKSGADNVMKTVAEASVLPRRRRKPGRPSKDGPKYGEYLDFENSSKQLAKQSRSRIKEVIPNEVKSVVDNDIMIVAEVSDRPERKRGRPSKNGPKRKRGRPSKNGPKDGKSLELKGPSKQHEEQSQSAIEVVLNEVKPPADSIMTTVAEALVLPKRKRGRPSKWSVDLASQGNRKNLSGKDSNQLKLSRPRRECKKCPGCESESMLSGLSRAPQMAHNYLMMQRSKFSTQKQSRCSGKLDIQSPCKVEQERKKKTSDAVPTNTMVADVNFTFTNVETMELSNRKKFQLQKESPDFPSPGQQQGLLDRSTGLMLSQCTGGCLKGSGKRSDSKEKFRLPDSTITAIERISDGLSGAELTPICQPLEKKNVSGQNVAKILNRRLDDNCDKVEKIIEKNLLGDQKLSTENESLDPNSEIACLHKKKSASRPVSLDKGFNEDVINHREAPRKLLRSKIFSREEKIAPQKIKKEIGVELVGKTIRVWWPRDKKFYVGVVESYDFKCKKHKVIYHDGDVEVLRLRKERWELIDGNPMSIKEVRTSIKSAKSNGFYVGVVESYDPEYRRHKVMYRDGDVEVLRLGREQWELIDGNHTSKKVMRTAVKSATSNGERSLYKTRSKTGLQNVNSSAHGILKQRSNAFSSESEKYLSERTAGSLVSTDANAPATSKGYRQENQGSEGRKVRRKTPLTKPIRRVLRSVKETKEKRNRSYYKRRGGLAVA